jgi:hypothetical protein
MYTETLGIEVSKCATCEARVLNPPKSKRVVQCENCRSVERTGLTLREVAAKKQREYAEKQRAKQSATGGLKRVSKKQVKKDAQIKTAKMAVLAAAQESDQVFCGGCGTTNGLTFSHNVGVAQSKDLADKPDNIDLMCMECHAHWESNICHRLLRLKNIVKLLRFQHDHAPEKFNKKVNVLLIYKSKKANQILSQLEMLEI